MALHSYEARIMDLSDDGASIDEIMRATGYARSTVTETVGRLRISGKPSNFDRKAEAGTRRLLAALHRYHPARCAQ